MNEFLRKFWIMNVKFSLLNCFICLPALLSIELNFSGISLLDIEEDFYLQICQFIYIQRLTKIDLYKSKSCLFAISYSDFIQFS